MFNLFKKKKKEPRNIKDVLVLVRRLEKEIKKVSEDIRNIRKESEKMIKKVGIVRYNPFSNVGGDQSFSIALLDEKNNGVVITSLYTNEGNRVYAKPITNSESKYSLSKEEEEAVARAISSGIPNS